MEIFQIPPIHVMVIDKASIGRHVQVETAAEGLLRLDVAAVFIGEPTSVGEPLADAGERPAERELETGDEARVVGDVIGSVAPDEEELAARQ